jgi:hypothetical protein
MNIHQLFKITTLAIVVLLAVTAAVPWRTQAAPAPAAPVPGGPGFQMVNAYQFRPAFPASTWDYFEGELNNPGPQDSFYEAALSLPNNITITGVVVYFYDNSEKDLAVGLWRIDPSTGDWIPLAEVGSSGAQDLRRNVADTSIDVPLIDQQNYSYTVEVYIPAAFNTLRLAAVRIDYAYAVHLPLVTKNP